MPYELDSSDWPVLYFRFTGRLTSGEADHYFRDCDDLIAGTRPYVCLMDGTAMLTPDTEFVRRQAHWIRDHEDAIKRLNRGTAFVMPSALVRGLVRAVMYFQPLPVPYESFARLDEARIWAAAQAKAAR